MEEAGAKLSSSVDETRDYIAAVGLRVRELREQRGLSRRRLSEISGVSQRYLAQLETGAGNITIGLLRSVARAIGCSAAELAAEITGPDAQIAELLHHYRNASDKQQLRLLTLLRPQTGQPNRANRLALIGMRGAGKSTLGQLLAKQCKAPLLELNRHIEQHSGMTIADVMAIYGHEGYRRMERQSLEALALENDRMILAVSGGVVNDEHTYALLRHRCHTIWLKATPEEHMARVRAQGDFRPMAGHPSAIGELREILAAREPLYAQADVELNTSEKTLDESLQHLKKLVEDNGFLGDSSSSIPLATLVSS
ncbi:MAG: helix-turn-helix transcriptional regulator [Granulosicoccaceae bacterium]